MPPGNTPIADSIEAALGLRPDEVTPLSGGCVGEVYRVEAGGRRLVVKVAQGPSAALDVEGRMLAYLAKRSALPVPGVVHAEPTLLAMEWIDNDGRQSPQGQAEAADMLADLHDLRADRYGFHENTLIGPLTQVNAWSDDWRAFYGEHRLLHFGRLADQRGALPPGTLRALERLANRLDRVVDHVNAPGLIHGDAWSGNVLWRGGHIAGFIDPAVHYADPEVELAFIHLFGCFGAPFWDRYRERRAVPGFDDGGWARRCAVYQLAPLLVHAILFGGHYGSAVAARVKSVDEGGNPRGK